MKSTDRYVVDGVLAYFHGRELPVANLSVGGFFVSAPHPPLPGEMLTVELRLNDDARPITVKGSVVWVNEPLSPRAPHLPAGCGVRIREVALQDKLALLDHLKRIQGGERHIPRMRR